MSNGYVGGGYNAKVSVLLFASCSIMKPYCSMKLARSDPFRLYLIEKDNFGKGEGLMKRYFSRRDR